MFGTAATERLLKADLTRRRRLAHGLHLARHRILRTATSLHSLPRPTECRPCATSSRTDARIRHVLLALVKLVPGAGERLCRSFTCLLSLRLLIPPLQMPNDLVPIDVEGGEVGWSRGTDVDQWTVVYGNIVRLLSSPSLPRHR
jgi:hypothetical protein